MKVFFKILLIPYFFIWLVNSKIAVGSEFLYLSFLYAYVASLVIIAIIALFWGLKRSSILAIGVLVFLLAPTLFFQWSGLSDAVAFDHVSGFPTGVILKLTLIVWAFIAFNELLARRCVTVAYVLALFALAVLASIPKYVFENYEALRYLSANNRPFPVWIGGWNTYGFILSLAFMIVYNAVSVAGAVKYSVLSVVFGVMITTLSRGAILALLVTLFLSWRSTRRSTRRRHSTAKFVLAATLLVAIVVATLPGVGATIYDRFVTSFLESQYEGADYLQSVSSARSVLWADTLAKLFSTDHYYQWLFGYGVGHYAYETDYGFESAIGNQYLLFVYEFGWIVGVGLSLFMFMMYRRLKWRSDVLWARTIKALFAIFLVSCFVEEFTYTTQVEWILGVGAALVLDVMRRERQLRSRSGLASEGARSGHGETYEMISQMTGKAASITTR